MLQHKPYKVSRTQGQPHFDSVPVAKIIDYPLEKRDYKPFSQCILCVGDNTLYLRMWAFEVSPPITSTLRFMGYLFSQQPDTALCIDFEHGTGDLVDVRAGLYQGPALPNVEQHPHNGEDLQGVYWGRTLLLPLPVLEKAGGPVLLQSGDRFSGNFYKLCQDTQFAHHGSFFPAAFPDHPFSPESTGTFEVVSY